jgi:hypothetical protein
MFFGPDNAGPNVPNNLFNNNSNNNNDHNNHNNNHNNNDHNNHNNNHNNNDHNHNNNHNEPINNDASNPLKGKILFSADIIAGKLNIDVRDFEVMGFYIVYENQSIEYNRLNDNVDEYNFKPSNTYLRISHGWCNIGPTAFIYTGATNFHSKYIYTCDELNPKLNELRRFLDILIAKQRGRELTSVLRVGKNRGLPFNMECLIGTYITGKPGTVKAQSNRLQQNAGIHIAPRLAGGKRKTRKYPK